MKQFMGFDPGKKGFGVAISESGDILTKFRYPLIGKYYDIQAFIRFFSKIDPKITHVVIEDVKALQGIMGKGNWELSRGKTLLELCCIFHNIPYTLVHSKTWQKEIWQGVVPIKKGKKTDTKATTLVAIQRLFPGLDLRSSDRAKVPDEGFVDSLALAEYCRRKFR